MIQLLYRNYIIDTTSRIVKVCGILMRLLLHINLNFIKDIHCMTIVHNGSAHHYLIGFIDKIFIQNQVYTQHIFHYNFVLQFDYRIIEKVKEVGYGYNEES